MPELTVQNVGRYFSEPMGDWRTTRGELPAAMLANIAALPRRSGADRLHLDAEISLHWHCLSQVEKVSVLEAVGLNEDYRMGADLGSTDPNRPAVFSWVDRILYFTNDAERGKIAQALTEPTRTRLRVSLDCHHQPQLKGRFSRYRNGTAVDQLYDYRGFMEANGGIIGHVPDDVASRKKVAIIGAGAAGLSAAFALNNAGVNVTVYEADERIGGRLRSEKADGRDTPSRFEMGAMRFPANAGLFAYFAELLNVERIPDFPNPGKVVTRFLVEGRVFEWTPGQKPDSEVMRRVQTDFAGAIASITTPMEAARGAGDTGLMRQLWQEHLTKYEKLTFIDGVRSLLRDNGIEWDEEAYIAFGALGVGSGGFGPLNQVGFAEILRLVLDGMEEDQQFLPKGTADFAASFTTHNHRGAGEELLPSLLDKEAIKLNSEVTNVVSRNGRTNLTIGRGAAERTETYDAVIYTGSPPAAEHLLLTLKRATSDPVLSETVASALKNARTIPTSKLFIQVDNPPWRNDPSFPRVIQTDESMHQCYALDYPGSDRGVVLVSYAWADKSKKIEALAPEERLAIFREQIRRVSPAFADCLTPVDGKIYCVDWQQEKRQYGAFKLDSPGAAKGTNETFSQFQSVLPENPQPNSGIYFAGDGVSNKGGWVVGAFETAINAACAALQHIGGTVAPNSPLTQDTKMYEYPSY